MGTGYCHAVGVSRHGAWLLALLLGVAACGSSQSVPTTLPEVEEEGGTRELPGDPVLLELDTNRAHVVQIIESEEVAETGRLQISSTVAGVIVSIDGGAQVPLPQSIDVETGIHEVIATCPDSTIETMNITVEPTATVHLRVCNSMPRP